MLDTSRTLRLLPLLFSVLLALLGSLALGAEIPCSIAIDEPTANPVETWVDTTVHFHATAQKTIEGNVRQEIANEDATLTETYSWMVYPATVVSGGDGDDDYVNISYPKATTQPAMYTVSVYYSVTVTYNDQTPPDYGYAMDSRPVKVKRTTVMVSSNKYAICAGHKSDNPPPQGPHQATITANVTDGWGTSLSGRSVSFTADHDYNLAAPSCSGGGTTDANGNTQTTLTSGDGAVYGMVHATCEGMEGTYPVSFEQPYMWLQFVDPQSGQPVQWLIADGQSQARVILTEMYSGTPVDQHSIEWKFRFTQASDQSPDYEGTGAPPYGSISPVSGGATDANGQTDTIYTIGTIGGMIYVEASDVSAYHR